MIDKLALIYIKDKKVLVARSFGKYKFFLPGGKRENDESNESALKREIKEELNVQLSNLKYYKTFKAPAYNQPPGTQVQMTCYFAELSTDPTPSNEIEKIDFYDFTKKNELPIVTQLIFESLRKDDLI